MSEHIEIGMLCHKGSGHSAFRGETDYGVCGSKSVGKFMLSLDLVDDSFDEGEHLRDAVQYIEDAIRFYDEAREKRMWDEYEAGKAE